MARSRRTKTAGKVATDEHSWELYVAEQGVVVGEYPSTEQVVEFAIWLSMHRERACLAQRADSGPRLTGVVLRTIRNMISELFNHAWAGRGSGRLTQRSTRESARHMRTRSCSRWTPCT